MSDQLTGTVIFFDGAKRFGFLRRDDRQTADLFVHARALRGVSTLEPGQKVSFQVVDDPRKGKPCAANVRLVDQGVVEDTRTPWWAAPG